MKRTKDVISILLCTLFILQTACGNTGGASDTADNGVGNEVNQAESADNSSGNRTNQAETAGGNGSGGNRVEVRRGGSGSVVSEPNQLLHSDYLFPPYGSTITQTWQKDYTSAEWEDGICLNVYVQEPHYDNDWIDVVEDELNHRLYLSGYHFYVHFEQPDFEEVYNRITGNLTRSADGPVAQRQQSGMTIDMYMTGDYREAVKNGKLLELTDYLRSEEGNHLYAHYDPLVWQQLADEEGRIYGVPTRPVAASRCVYVYNPQFADVLGIDIAAFNGDLSGLEETAHMMLEQGILPLEIYEPNGDAASRLMLQMFGLENYAEIFAIRHTGDSWEAIDLFEEEEAVTFYERLGIWRESGFLDYSIKEDYGLEEYDYIFLSLRTVDGISNCHDLNYRPFRMMESSYYIPQELAFITENGNSDILVIDADTAYPQECMQFLSLLATDDEIRMLLHQGIENYHYIWQDDVCVYDGYGAAFMEGLGLEYDYRFLTAEYWSDKFANEIEELNRGVIDGISLTVDCDFDGLEEQYEACLQLMENNSLIFLGYYGAETGERLQALHEQLNEAGYQELIAAVNAMH